MRAAVSIAAIAVLLASRPAMADEPAPRPISKSRQALAITAAIVPGIVVRGLGSRIVKQERTANRLAWMAGIGFGAMLLGGLPVAVSRGNPYTILPSVPLVVLGTGTFLTSWFGDLWVAAGGACGAGVPRAPVPYSLELGTTWLDDAYRNRALLRGGVRVALGRVELSVGGHQDAKGAATYGDVGARVRILGAAPTGNVIDDGTALWVRGMVRGRDDDDDRVRVLTGEIEVLGRLDLARIDPLLRGTFGELGAGLGAERISLAGGRESEIGSLLLSRFAFGAYLGRRGELSAFYDHRRDQLAGGIAAGRAAGFVGSVGTRLDLRVAGPWAIGAEYEFGSARLATLVLRYQGGPP